VHDLHVYGQIQALDALGHLDAGPVVLEQGIAYADENGRVIHGDG
jgi:hypothetical protein